MNLSALARDVINVNSGFRKGRGVGHVRLIPVQAGMRLTTEECVKLLQDAGKSVLRIIQPGDILSKSSEFLTYEIKDQKDETAFVVFGLGKTDSGTWFEKNFYEDLQLGEYSKFIPLIKQHVGNFTLEKVTNNSTKKVIRPFDLSPKNMGDTIADVIINDSIFLSLKNGKGSIMVGHGIKDSFYSVNSEIKYEKSHVMGLVLEEVGVNIDKMVYGLNNYSSQTYSMFNRQEGVQIKNNSNLKELIGAAHGYGYYIVKKLGNSYDVIDITTLEKLNNYIGDVVSAELIYPYYITNGKKSKSMIIRVLTDKHTFQFVIRNKNGDVMPNTLELVKL